MDGALLTRSTKAILHSIGHSGMALEISPGSKQHTLVYPASLIRPTVMSRKKKLFPAVGDITSCLD